MLASLASRPWGACRADVGPGEGPSLFACICGWGGWLLAGWSGGRLGLLEILEEGREDLLFLDLES